VPEARRDPLTGRWVILAPDRAARPDTVTDGRAPRPGEAEPTGDPTRDCPFCPGHEDRTPPEIARTGTGPPGRPGWRVRVVPNRYPLVDGPPSAAGDAGPTGVAGDVLRHGRPVTGAHEVVVLSPDHHSTLAHLDDDQVREVVTMLRDRVRAHSAAGHAYTQVFVNQGAGGGASIAHPHAQVVAVDLDPPNVAGELDELEATAVDAEGGGPCILCDEITRHRGDAELAVVVDPGGGDVWCPWWSATGFELLVAPVRHRPRFEDVGEDGELAALARVLRDGLARLGATLDDPAYNLAVHSLPAGRPAAGAAARYHWHVHVWPRLQQDAGFELGAGVRVTTVDPADAAARLRGGSPPSPGTGAAGNGTGGRPDAPTSPGPAGRG